MALYYYRRYYFSDSVKNKWDALVIAKGAEQIGKLNAVFDGEWVKVVDDSGGWLKSFTKQFLGK
jgi:hypothetical protein